MTSSEMHTKDGSKPCLLLLSITSLQTKLNLQSIVICDVFTAYLPNSSCTKNHMTLLCYYKMNSMYMRRPSLLRSHIEKQHLQHFGKLNFLYAKFRIKPPPYSPLLMFFSTKVYETYDKVSSDMTILLLVYECQPLPCYLILL